jgi:3-hydroxyisobutyrate dehydrogenase-like beta-hydroxyacid dehydrogenase
MCGGSVKAFARAKPFIENMDKRIVQRPRRSKLGDPSRR